MIGDIGLSPTAINAIIQRIPAGVHAHEARARGTPWSAVIKDEQWFVFAFLVRGVKAVPDPRLGRPMGQSRKITPIMKIESNGFDVDKSSFVSDGQMFRTVEATGVEETKRQKA
jgi:hypothetical protein